MSRPRTEPEEYIYLFISLFIQDPGRNEVDQGYSHAGYLAGHSHPFSQ